MAINITLDTYEPEIEFSLVNWQRTYRTNSFTGSVTISFTGITPAGEVTQYSDTRSYNVIKEYRKGVVTKTYQGTSRTFNFTADDFNWGTSSTTHPYFQIWIGTGGFLPEDLPDQDVYINGVKDGSYTSTNNGFYLIIKPSKGVFKPKITSCSEITIQQIQWNNLPIAGESILKIDSVKFSNSNSSDINKYFSYEINVVGGANSTDRTVTKVAEGSYKITNINCPASDTATYTLSVIITAYNEWGGSASITKSITVYPYHLPRLFLNTTGDVSYVTRCQEDGTADGLGAYGKLHIVWDVEKINTASSPINTLQSAVVVLNETTTLSPKKGSLSDGYLEYIFPLDLSLQGNLAITLTDTRKTNTITALAVPKGSMPFSMYDGGGSVGVAFGVMASEAGAWCYMPFYLKSSTLNSSKMFQIQVTDDGVIKAVEV